LGSGNWVFIDFRKGKLKMSSESPPVSLDELRRRIGGYDPQQVKIWRAMTPARRIAVACQMYSFALGAIRVQERKRHPDLSQEELNWRVIRRLHGNQKLGILDATPSS
jgi:hypothetical protein